MNSLIKNQKILILIIIIVLIFGGIFYFSYLQNKKISTPPETKVPPKEEEKQVYTGVFSLLATISEINSENKYLIVKSLKEKKEIKVILSEETKFIQLKFPFDPANPPKDANFTLEEIPIEFKDLKTGNQILIKAGQDITGKSELDNVVQVQVMP